LAQFHNLDKIRAQVSILLSLNYVWQRSMNILYIYIDNQLTLPQISDPFIHGRVPNFNTPRESKTIASAACFENLKGAADPMAFYPRYLFLFATLSQIRCSFICGRVSRLSTQMHKIFNNLCQTQISDSRMDICAQILSNVRNCAK
jgi:hypothetical protein